MPVEYLTPATENRAVEVQLLLASQGQHRAPSIPDVLIAATAELAGLWLQGESGAGRLREGPIAASSMPLDVSTRTATP